MTIPVAFQSSQYPTNFDVDQNLFLVHDALRVSLAEDYDPNDSIVANQTIVYVDGDTSLFPPTGIITLTEQCSDIGQRAISFFYTTVTTTTFEGLIPIPGFENSNTIVRPKRLTHVTQNVMAQHHNSIKDALIAIEDFIGVKGTTNTRPFGTTLEGRINFLRNLVLSPRAWFTANNTIGLVPLTISFANESFRIGTDGTDGGTVDFLWNFGDQDPDVSNISTISVSDVVPISSTNVFVQETGSNIIQKTYTKPGKYNVSLTVTNKFGTDVVVFEDFITARTEAPIEAIIDYSATSSQILTPGTPTGGPYDLTPPKIRSKTNQYINIIIPSGVNEATNATYSGEAVDQFNNPIDPIENYTWDLSDDLIHANSQTTSAAYSIGGIYDLVLRCDTEFGAYRITNYIQSIDIIEDRNMWLFTIAGSAITSNEFGLISETFKTGTNSFTISQDSTFLNGTNNSTQAITEFNRNTGFTMNTTVTSGSHGTALLCYASGGSTPSSQTVNFIDFDGFSGTIASDDAKIYRPWNWIFLPFAQKAYFLFGEDVAQEPNVDFTNQLLDSVNLGGSTSVNPSVLLNNPVNFLNGANELLTNITSGFDLSGQPNNGRFATYRSTVYNDSTGYFLRNDGAGNFFKIRQFYQTEGTSAEPVINIRKLQDMSGQAKTEGELVSLTNGVFFFNNSGNISAFNIVDNTWEIGNSTAPFGSLQDNTVDGYSSISQTLLATSDGARIAYLSFDYSPNAFVKYNSVDKTFYSVGTRPNATQWSLGIY